MLEELGQLAGELVSTDDRNQAVGQRGEEGPEPGLAVQEGARPVEGHVWAGESAADEPPGADQQEGSHREHENEERARARRFAFLLLAAQEKEQRRIAQELHDEPLQLLVHLARTLDRAGLEEPRQEVLDISARIRAVLAGLRPPALDRLGLVPALTGLVGDDGAGPQMDLEVTGDGGRLPPDVELAVFRIAQEAVNNAVTHGRPQRIGVEFHRSGGRLRLRVTDDGRGFDPRSAGRRADSFGLTGMQERAELLGGRLQVTSAPGAGTTVELAVDLPDQRGRNAPMASSMCSGRGGHPATSASTGR